MRTSRDANVDVAALDDVPRGLWITGGAGGFDKQVEDYARAHQIPLRIIRPNYGKNGRTAPLIRNRQIVAACEILIACHDGRKTGGTVYTMEQARKAGKPVRVIQPTRKF